MLGAAWTTLGKANAAKLSNRTPKKNQFDDLKASFLIQ
jgi:hypothetical protein